jgi:hypothetical protein
MNPEKKRVASRRLSWLLLLALLLSACGPATPTVTQVEEATPAASEPGHAPDGWQMHTSGQWAVSFAVPATWQEVETDRFEGKDGFAQLEAFTGPGVSVDQACEWEANYHRESYGLAPALNSLSRDNLIDAKGQPCLIHSSDKGSAIVLPNPKSVGGETPFLLLSVDREHFLGVAQSLDYRLELGPAPTLSDSSFGRTLSAEDVPDNLPLETSTFGDLTLEEYTIIDAGVDGPGHFEFSQRIPPAVMDRRRAWREKPPARNRLDPIQVDGKPIAVAYADYGGVPVTGGMMYSTAVSVQSDGQEVSRYNMSSAHAGTFPLYYLGNWAGRWVLEANGMLIVNGQIVNQEWGDDEIFGCQELNGQPFYFFIQDGQAHLSCGGETLPVSYDYVYHGMCCEPAAFNAGGNDQMVWFYALKDGAWHYVELGAFDQ